METVDQMLAQHPFLKGLEKRYLRQLASLATPLSFKPLKMIFHEGDDANEFYLIQQGQVAIEMFMLGCEALQIQALEAGEVLGWSWLVPPYHWHFSARAIEPTQVIALDGRALRTRCEEDHDLGYEILKRFTHVVVQRLEATRLRALNVPHPR
jgi:CRP-like cAMP-binding protein